jgi:hypothetical protein
MPVTPSLSIGSKKKLSPPNGFEGNRLPGYW